MPTRRLKGIRVPTLRLDGEEIGLILEFVGGEVVTSILTADLRPVINKLIDALDAADITETLSQHTPAERQQFKPSPTVIRAQGLGFVSEPKTDLRCISIQSERGQEFVIVLHPDQLQMLLSKIQALDNIQTDPLSGPEN